MEQETSPQLFSLVIDPTTKAHLTETAKWAKFLAIVGMVFLVLGILAAVVLPSFLFKALERRSEFDASNFPSFMPVIFGVYAVIASAIWFFPLLFTLRFANKMQAALRGNDQQELNGSFANLKGCLRFMGIVTIIVLGLYLIGLVLFIVAMSMAGR